MSSPNRWGRGRRGDGACPARKLGGCAIVVLAASGCGVLRGIARCGGRAGCAPPCRAASPRAAWAISGSRPCAAASIVALNRGGSRRRGRQTAASGRRLPFRRGYLVLAASGCGADEATGATRLRGRRAAAGWVGGGAPAGAGWRLRAGETGRAAGGGAGPLRPLRENAPPPAARGLSLRLLRAARPEGRRFGPCRRCFAAALALLPVLRRLPPLSLVPRARPPAPWGRGGFAACGRRTARPASTGKL